MRKSTMRRRLGELEQALADRTAERDELADNELTLRLTVQNLEARIRRGTAAVDVALAQLNPLSQSAQFIQSARLELVPEDLGVRRG